MRPLQDRLVAMALVVMAVVLGALLSQWDSAWAMLAVAAGVVAALAVMGLGLLRMLAFQGSRVALWGAAPVMGFAAAVVLCNLPLLFGLSAPAQAMALVLGLMSLGTAGVLAPSAVKASDGDGGKGSAPGTRLALGAVALGLVAAWLPLGVGGAWSVAGHDLDTLQHQDGALHVMMVVLCGEGAKPTPSYPIGLHAFMSGLGSLLRVDAFQAFAVTLVVLQAVAAASAVWAASACGSRPSTAALAGALVALHPLLLFTGMEQFAPQLAAAALVPAALASAVAGHEGHPRTMGLLAVVLAALLSVYGLALAVAAPVVALAALRAPLAVSARRLGVAILVAACLAPLGTWRLTTRLGGGRDAPQSPIKAATRAPDSSRDGKGLLAPDVDELGRDAASALTWEITAAHVAGAAPYRDHFLRTARLVHAGLGREVAETARPLMWMWAAGVVPTVTLLLLLLVLVGVAVRMANKQVSMGLGMLAALAAAGGAIWLGAGSGIRPYYGFKLASLSAGLMMVAVAGALDWVLGRLPRGWSAALLWGVLLTRAPAVLAVEVEYSRALALDRDFTRIMEPALAVSARRSARAEDNSPTRRYWESRLLFARAREVPAGESADVVLCVSGRSCTMEEPGRVVARSGPYTLWARRRGGSS